MFTPRICTILLRHALNIQNTIKLINLLMMYFLYVHFQEPATIITILSKLCIKYIEYNEVDQLTNDALPLCPLLGVKLLPRSLLPSYPSYALNTQNTMELINLLMMYFLHVHFQELNSCHDHYGVDQLTNDVFPPCPLIGVKLLPRSLLPSYPSYALNTQNTMELIYLLMMHFLHVHLQKLNSCHDHYYHPIRVMH